MFQIFGLYTFIRHNRIKTTILFVILFFLAYLFLFCIYLFFHKSQVATDTIDVTYAMKAGYEYGRALDSYFLAVVQEAWGSFFLWTHYVLAFVAVWVVLGILFYRVLLSRPFSAERVTRKTHAHIYNILETLSISAGIRLPALYVIDTQAMNAFAMALTPEHSAVVVTQGLIDKLDDQELDAVLAHELTHIKNRDSLVLVTAVVITGIMTFLLELMMRNSLGLNSAQKGGTVATDPLNGGDDNLRDFNRLIFLVGHGKIMLLLRALLSIFLMALVWLGALAVRFAISRTREYLADAGAVELTKNPNALISALLKISGKSDVYSIPSSAMQMCFDNPRTDFMRVFATHPSIEQRVQRLIDVCGGSLPEKKKKATRPFETRRFRSY